MTVSAQIIEVLDAICDKFGIVIDWTSTNVLPYLQELAGKLVAFEIATSVAWIAIPIVLCCILFLIASYARKKDMNSDVAFTCTLFGVGISVIGVIIIGTQIFDIITCITLPEKMLLHEIQEILRMIK